MLYSINMIEAEVHKMISTLDFNEQTKTNYENYCCQFFGWWYKENPDGDPIKVDADDVLIWLNEHKNWASATKYSAGAAVKKFYRWKYGEFHSVNNVKVRRVDPGPQRTLDQDELLDVLASIDTTTITGIRDLAMISVMVDTGIRSSEVCNLDLAYLNMDKQKFTVIVKGGYLAEKLFFDYTALCLSNWISLREKVAMKGTTNVFVSVGGKTPGLRLTPSGIRYVSAKMSKISGLTKFSPHSLRRTFATLATENGAPSRVIQVAGGWKSIRMVERYTRALKPEAIKPYSPIDKLMSR